MKTKINQTTLLAIFLFFLFFINDIQAQDYDSTHIRLSAVYQDTWPFVFYNTDENAGFITNFPLEKIRQEIAEDILNDWEINYNVHTSVEDAEISLIEQFETSSLGMYNMVDSMLPNGPIGNNCWHILRMGTIRFIRNNVFVTVYPKKQMSDEEEAKVEWIARKVDTILIESDKVYDAELIPAPEIQSIEIISDLPENWDESVKIKVNATDPNSQQLTYRQYGAGRAIISNTGDLTVIVSEHLKVSEDSTIARVKIWVWNTNNIVELVEYDIPIKTSTNNKVNFLIDKHFKIYPNPTNEAFTIETQNPETTFGKLYNTTGVFIKTLPIEQGINTYHIAELKSGVYFIQVPQKEGVVVKKFVKN